MVFSACKMDWSEGSKLREKKNLTWFHKASIRRIGASVDPEGVRLRMGYVEKRVTEGFCCCYLLQYHTHWVNLIQFRMGTSGGWVRKNGRSFRGNSQGEGFSPGCVIIMVISRGLVIKWVLETRNAIHHRGNKWNPYQNNIIRRNVLSNCS